MRSAMCRRKQLLRTSNFRAYHVPVRVNAPDYVRPAFAALLPAALFATLPCVARTPARACVQVGAIASRSCLVRTSLNAFVAETSEPKPSLAGCGSFRWPVLPVLRRRLADLLEDIGDADAEERLSPHQARHCRLRTPRRAIPASMVRHVSSRVPASWGSELRRRRAHCLQPPLSRCEVGRGHAARSLLHVAWQGMLHAVISRSRW